MSKKENWIWMPHPGHFIGAYNCHFFLNTYVGKYLVSTVGEWQGDEDKRGDWKELGIDRTYETFVFKADKNKGEWQCCPYEVSDYGELDTIGSNNPVDARKNHMKLCNKWSKK